MRAVHAEVEGTRSRTGAFNSTLGTRLHEADTRCGKRLSPLRMTKRSAAVTCPTCIEAPTSARTEDLRGD